MGIRESYARGNFNWVDLMTTDPKAAKDFYGELLGWTFVEEPMANGEIYAIAQKDRRNVTAIFELPSDLSAQGIPAPDFQSMYFSGRKCQKFTQKTVFLAFTQDFIISFY